MTLQSGVRVPAGRFVAAVLLAIVPAAPVAAGQRSTRRTPAPPAVVAGPLAERMPADTSFYLEITGTKSDAERAAASEMYRDYTVAYAGMFGGALPLTLDEFQMLAASNIAVCVRLQGLWAGSGRTGYAAVVRTPSASAAAALRARVADVRKLLGPKNVAARPVTIRGWTFTPLSDATSPDAPWLGAEGDTIVVGDRETIARVLADPAADGGASVASTPLYRDGAGRLGPGASLFMLMAISGQMTGGKVLEDDSSFPSVLGVPSLRGIVSGSNIWEKGAGGTTLVAIERGRRNLLTVLAGGPPVSLRAADTLPSDTGAVVALGLDLAGIAGVARSSKALADTGIDVAALDRLIGMSAAGALVPALGTDVTVGVRFEVPAASMVASGDGSVSAAPPSPEVKVVVLFEARRPDVVRTALENLVTALSRDGTSVRETGGVRVMQGGTLAVAIADGIALLGEPAEVERVLLARSVGQTLAATRELDGTRSHLDDATIAVVHPTSAMRESLQSVVATMAGPFSGTDLGSALPGDTLFQKEPLGVAIQTPGSSSMVAGVIGIVAAIAIPSLIRARSAANEATAIGTLRSLASAQATFSARHGRYGTMAELAAARMIAPELSHGVERNGYVFTEVRPTKSTFEFSAAPKGLGGGERSYTITEDFVIRWGDAKTPPRRRTGKPIG